MQTQIKEASISLRRSIKWAEDIISEPTSTLVLASPQSRFVDIRVLFEDAKSAANTFNVTPSGEARYLEDEPTVRASLIESATVTTPLLSRLDWGIAGTSSSTPAHEDVATGRQIPTHSRWAHTISSRCHNRDAIRVVDEGDMFPISDTLELEKGEMSNPETGQVTAYEEVWQALDTEAVDDEGERICAVFVTLDRRPGDDLKGTIVRAGRYVQGIARQNDEVRAQRWQWRKGKSHDGQRIGDYEPSVRQDTSQGMWLCLVDIGSRAVEVPCRCAFGSVKELEERAGQMKSDEVMGSNTLDGWRMVELAAYK